MRRLKQIALLLAIMLLTGCAPVDKDANGLKSDLSPKNPVVVTLWHYYVGENQLALEQAVTTFNQTVGVSKGVIVDPIAKGSISELEGAITNSVKGVINSDPMPQIFSSYPDKALEIDKYGILVDLNDYFTEEQQAAYVSDFLADGTFDEGRILTLPIVKSTELTYVNATSWEEFTQAEKYDTDDLGTWEALYETARAYYNWTDAKTPDDLWDGTALMGFDSVANFIITGSKQLGLDIIDAQSGEAGCAVLDQEVMRQLFDIYYPAISMGYFGAEGKFRSDDIKTGDMIAYVGSSSSAAYFPTWIEKDMTQEPISFHALPYPTFENGKSYAIQQGAGMCVTASTPAQQEGSALFLKWFTGYEHNIPFAMATGYLPVQTEAFEADEFEAALSGLSSGEQQQQNIAAVYEITLKQITESNTYSAKPFEGSYSLRSLLQSTLTNIALEGKAAVDELKANGATEAEVLDVLNIDASFAAWQDTLTMELDKAEIEYIVN